MWGLAAGGGGGGVKGGGGRREGVVASKVVVGLYPLLTRSIVPVYSLHFTMRLGRVKSMCFYGGL